MDDEKTWKVLASEYLIRKPWLTPPEPSLSTSTRTAPPCLVARGKSEKEKKIYEQ